MRHNRAMNSWAKKQRERIQAMLLSPSKPLRFAKVREANVEIERLESELAKRTTPPPMPTPSSKPTPQPAGPASPLPSWSECSRDFASAKTKLVTRLNAWAGRDCLDEILKGTGM